MKMKTVLLLLVGMFCFATTQPVLAITSSTATTTEMIANQSKELKKEFKAKQKTSKFQNFLQKAGIDLKDPVEKWLWFGLGLWIISAIMWILPGIGLFAGLVSLAGTICIVYWLYKKFAS